MKTLSKNPWIYSLLIIIALSIWMASGMLKAEPTEQHNNADESALSKDKGEPAIPRVRVRKIAPQKVTSSLTLYGISEPARSLDIRTRLSGQIKSVLIARGEQVKQGQLLAMLELDDLSQQLEHAQAEQAQRELVFKSSRSLSKKGYQGKAQLAEARALLKLAEARVKKLQLDIEHSRITAPFSGIINENNMEPGLTVAAYDKLATLIEIDPLIVRGDVSQLDRQIIKPGQVAHIKFNNGVKTSGRIRFLSAQAHPQTNTFRLEVELANPGRKMLAGMSAEINIPLKTETAIKITPALFSLNEAGDIGIKWVRQGQVEFSPIQIVKTEADGVWISGINPQASIITVGQAFVKKGDRVKTVSEKDSTMTTKPQQEN